MNDEITKRVKLESYLRKALDKNELFLNYQPQIDIRNGKIIGVEALLRWRHPKLNIIPPLDFIPIAEDTKMILQIGKFALKKAISQLKEWQKSGIRDIKMVVNISAVQLAQGNLFETVKEILEQYEVDPKYFEIELTESVLMKNTQQAKKTLALFQKEGIEIAIDDFGTGYSSLAYLKKFPINRLKIDKTFIDDLPADTDDIAITKAIISMGKSLGMRVVAEGVEEKEQLDFLMEQGCDEVQGYCFSKPLLADEFVTFINIMILANCLLKRTVILKKKEKLRSKSCYNSSSKELL
jgi:EAL domain-containing protein (putative c-di-GMP-specific phosphodiesterase class I)